MSQEKKLISLDDLLRSETFWSIDRTGLTQRPEMARFAWVSTNREAARCTAGYTFLDEPVLEGVLRFGSNTISEVLLSFYNRGDAGDITEEAFEKRVATIDGKIRAFAGKPIKEVFPKETNSADRKSKTSVWTNGPCAYRFEHAFTRLRNKVTNRRTIQPEFVNLTILKSDKRPERELVSDMKVDVGHIALKNRVKKGDKGDVYIDSVPMVDQGQKGYCAVATTERVLRYYGMDVNQHELAQRAYTASKGGTDSGSLVTALKSMANSMGVRIKLLMQYEVNDYTKIVEDYNKEAKRKKLPTVTLAVNGVIDVGRIMDAMDKDIFLRNRQKNKSAVDRFLKGVKDQIAEGHPLLWGVTLGYIAEKPELPQAKGGHIRLIIGYNATSGEVFYTDSWGAGHEMKRMSAIDAYAITTCLLVIEPR